MYAITNNLDYNISLVRIGNLYGFTGGSFSGMVYGAIGLSPSINTAGGGNRMPIILEKKNVKTDNRSKSRPQSR